MSEKAVERLKEIIRCAYELDWLKQPERGSSDSYPSMQLSEVEKCMLAMLDDLELERLKRWATESKGLSEMMDAYHNKFDSHYTETRSTLKQPLFIIEPEFKTPTTRLPVTRCSERKEKNER